jgi:hypothetical protein
VLAIGLQELQALDLREYLTPLGYHLAALPVNVRIGKMMLYGVCAAAQPSPHAGTRNPVNRPAATHHSSRC